MKTLFFVLVASALGSMLMADTSPDPILGTWGVLGVETIDSTIDGVTTSESNVGPATLEFARHHQFMWTHGFSARGKWEKSGATYAADFRSGLQSVLSQLLANSHVEKAKATGMRLKHGTLFGELHAAYTFKADGRRVKIKDHGTFNS